jgi:hypothetical protein
MPAAWMNSTRCGWDEGDRKQRRVGALRGVFHLARQGARKLPAVSFRSCQDAQDTVVGGMACQFDRQVYGINIELV